MLEHLTSIVAIDQRGAIGCQNQLPWSIKNDMAFFRRMTMGNTVIMGRKTHDSIGGCLKGRRNLVLSHSFDLFPSTDNCRLVNSVDESLAMANSHGGLEAFIIGGAATYSVFAPLVDKYLVTFVAHTAHDADAFLAEEIRREFGGWDSYEVASYPVLEGVDQYAFRIVSFTAPDAAQRREERNARAERWLPKRSKMGQAPSKNRSSSNSTLQSAFSF